MIWRGPKPGSSTNWHDPCGKTTLSDPFDQNLLNIMRKLECKIGPTSSPEEILKALRYEFEGKLGDFLICDPPFFRAEYVEDSFSLDNVKKNESEGWFYLSYSLEWDFPSGCKDEQDSDTEMRIIRFQYKNGVAKFESEDGDARTTKDEF